MFTRTQLRPVKISHLMCESQSSNTGSFSRNLSPRTQSARLSQLSREDWDNAVRKFQENTESPRESVWKNRLSALGSTISKTGTQLVDRADSFVKSPYFVSTVEKSVSVTRDFVSKTREVANEEYKQFTRNIAAVNYPDLKRQVVSSPREYFIYGSLVVAPIVFPSASFLTAWQFYPSLANLQLMWSGILVTYFAGMRFGLSLVELGVPDRRAVIYCGVPLVMCWAAMPLPLPMSYLGAMSGLFASAYYDQIGAVYPETFHALRVFFTLVAIVALSVGLVGAVTCGKRVNAAISERAMH